MLKLQKLQGFRTRDRKKKIVHKLSRLKLTFRKTINYKITRNEVKMKRTEQAFGMDFTKQKFLGCF
jgi:hypothetical protein